MNYTTKIDDLDERICRLSDHEFYDLLGACLNRHLAVFSDGELSLNLLRAYSGLCLLGGWTLMLAFTYGIRLVVIRPNDAQRKQIENYVRRKRLPLTVQMGVEGLDRPFFIIDLPDWRIANRLIRMLAGHPPRRDDDEAQLPAVVLRHLHVRKAKTIDPDPDPEDCAVFERLQSLLDQHTDRLADKQAIETLKLILASLKTEKTTMQEMMMAAFRLRGERGVAKDRVGREAFEKLSDPIWLTAQIEATEGKLFTFDGSTIRKRPAPSTT
jgi:hypothetical protein